MNVYFMQILAEYEAVISSNYPQYLEELQGIADGSEISYHMVSWWTIRMLKTKNS